MHFAKILIAKNGLEALDILKTQAVEVVVTDYMMPNMDGVELVKRIKERLPLIPILMLTGNAQEDQKVVNALEQGAFDVIFKPYSIELLVNRIRNALLLPLLVQVLWSVMSKEWEPMKLDDFMRLPYQQQLKTIYAFAALLKTKGLRKKI